jgi:hypothetical protein
MVKVAQDKTGRKQDRNRINRDSAWNHGESRGSSRGYLPGKNPGRCPEGVEVLYLFCYSSLNHLWVHDPNQTSVYRGEKDTVDSA